MGPNNLVVRAYWFKETVVCVCDTEKKFTKITEHYHEFAGYSQQLGRPGVSWLNAVYPIYMNSIESIRDARFKFEPVKLMS